MAIVETATVTVGTAVAKWIVSGWLGESVVAEVAAETLDVLVGRIPDFQQRRRFRRQLEQIAERAADELAGLLSVEFRDVPENEVLAAVSAAGDTLEQGLTAIELAAIDYDPIRLRTALFDHDPGRARVAGLSEAGEKIYALTLSESCNYVVETAIGLPEFAVDSQLEILRRESAIIDLFEQVLRKLPSTVTADPAPGAREFESDYLRFMARTHDYLELFGLSASQAGIRYALSVAYITLSVSVSDRAEQDFVRVDEALAHTRRVFVRGAAGSGKTTLLQWLAVQSAREEFPAGLESWNDGAVPFLLQLRHFVPGELPAPDDFLRLTSASIVGATPPGWTAQQLRDGRALVLIDGIDEVAEGLRGRVRRWLHDLVAAYPRCRYVVTSRPAAVPEDWLDSDGFRSMEMLPMTLDDIHSFVDHWHRAAAKDLSDDAGLAELERYRTTLLETIVGTPQIKNLATAPLLCAMLCALNRDRRTKLPADRMQLYRIALEMLLDRRDRERDVRLADRTGLKLTHKMLLLRALAYWLMRNDQADADVETVELTFRVRLRNLRGVRDDAFAVLQHMLVRSGVLREPVPGRVDFLHRTFQEYFAAEEAIAAGDIPYLLERAHLDQWRELIVLAAGHARGREVDRLVRGLLKRGTDEPANRHTMFLLAVACLETAQEISPQVAVKVIANLDELVPPRNLTEARELASAGTLALPRLGEHSGGTADVAAACVRTASLVGGEDSLPTLAAYRHDRRRKVQRELLRAWANHGDPVAFARAVLTETFFAPLVIDDPALLPAVPLLRQAHQIYVRLAQGLHNTSVLGDLDRLFAVDVSSNPAVQDLWFLRGNSSLRILNADRCPTLGSLDGLAELTGLRILTLSSCPGLRDISALSGLPELQHLIISDCASVEDWTPLATLSGLRELDVSANHRISSLDFVRRLPELRRLDVSRLRAVDEPGSLATLEHLTELRMNACPALRSLSGFTLPERLHRFEISQASLVENLDALRQCHRLTVLTADRMARLADVSSLRGKPLSHVSLRGCEQLVDISPLAECPLVEQLDLRDTSVRDLAPLGELRHLQRISLTLDSPDTDLTPLLQLPSLERVTLADLHPDTDHASVARLAQRSRLFFEGDVPPVLVGYEQL